MKNKSRYKFLAKNTGIIIFLFFNVFLCKSVFSQADSLNAYLEIAARSNPLVMQKYYEYQASLQKVPQVGSLPDPEISLGIFLKPMELLGGKQVADIRLMQMFPWFGVLKSAKDEMSLMARAKFEAFRDVKLGLFYDVQRNWYELHKVKQKLRISDKNLAILQMLERLAIMRFQASPGGNAGSVSNQTGSSMQGNSMGASSATTGLADVYRIQIEKGELKNDIELLKNQWQTIAAQFNAYLNRSPSSVVSIPDTLTPDPFKPSLLPLSDSILNDNPMLGMLQYEQQSLEARKMMVTRMGYPMIGLGVNYALINKSDMSTSSMNGKDMIMPMVTATLPIYRKKYKAMQAETDLLESASKQACRATANTLQTEYYQAMQLYEDAQRRMSLYADQYKLASKSFDIMQRSFSSSGADLTDVLRIRQQAFDYEYKQMEAIADYDTAIAWINRLTGLSVIK